MTGRRQFLQNSFLSGVGVVMMTVPGAGGQQERPFNAPAGQATPVGVQPGTQAGITFARAVVVFGPSGAVNGIFVYQPGTKPAAGNGPVLSGTESSKDLYGNAVQGGWTAYSAPGSASWASLLSAALQLNSAGSVTPGMVLAGAAGGVTIDSGSTGAADNQAAVIAQSKNASGVGGRLVSLVADQVQLRASVSANIPVSSAGITTVAQVVAALVSCGVFS